MLLHWAIELKEWKVFRLALSLTISLDWWSRKMKFNYSFHRSQTFDSQDGALYSLHRIRMVFEDICLITKQICFVWTETKGKYRRHIWPQLVYPKHGSSFYALHTLAKFKWQQIGSYLYLYFILQVKCVKFLIYTTPINSSSLKINSNWNSARILFAINNQNKQKVKINNTNAIGLNGKIFTKNDFNFNCISCATP